MVRRVLKAVFGTRGTIIAVFLFSIWAILQIGLPASWYMRVASVTALDAVEGADVTLIVDRVIHRNFVGTWDVLVRRQTEDEGWEIVCTTSGRSNYRVDARLPDPITLRWWTGGKCSHPPPGRILISTVWTVHPDFGPSKVLVAESNFFTVREAPD